MLAVMNRARARRVKALAVLVAAVAAISVSPASASAQTAACAGAQATASAVAPSSVRVALRCLVNAIRAQHGLEPVTPSSRLNLAAQRHGADMVARRFFDHVSPSGGTLSKRVSRAGYLASASEWTLGEDIGWAPEGEATPAALLDAWMNSAAHRAVILEPVYREVGIGVAAGVPAAAGGPGTTFVLDLGVTS
ncbi:MAG: hypothetical protein QOI62_2820 [Solirubrobacteraceae bacterium]|jgi:uncharacterized protein YkwD|nr:hypothetical protein [Solirubrobacteraceae bacterium]MEA2277598.1 hypothetical protein [Solirubrobacteraceae bacterium]MEA2359560.1 hypothetical protein [Solirubrobacteraceae bacterium]